MANNPQTITDLRRNISDGIHNVQPDELLHVFSNMQRRANFCLQVHGARFQQLL